MDSVFQFFSFSAFQLFWNRNWKTEKLNFPGTFRQRFSIWIQFFSFLVFQFFSFRNYFEIFPEKLKNWKTKKLKNWKTEFSRDIQAEILHMDSVFQFFSFSVFQFFSFLVFQFLFRNISGETEKLKNWIFQGHSGRDSPYGFSFLVF